jgi:competence protein ComEA
MDEPAQDSIQSSLQTFFKTYRLPIILGSVSLLCIIVAVILLIKSAETVTPIQFSRTNDGIEDSTLGTQSANIKAMLVDVEGAVVKPGLVSLTAESRVEDAIVAAGGLTNTADETYIAQNINRAMKVADGMKVYVPAKDETSHNLDSNNIIGEMSHNLDSLVATSKTSSQNAGVVSVNFASKDHLDLLPGVGPATAQKIIDNRPYASLEDLVAKKAIGPSLFAKLKNMLSL